MAPDAIIVGVDIGGTKTHFRLRGPSGERDLIIQSSEWRHREWHHDAQALTELVTRFAEGDPVSAVGVGAHGCDDKAECEAFEVAIRSVAPWQVRVVNDAELMPAALGLEHQIGVVAGTGSIAVCRTSDGEMLVAGGWGWIIGDEGSAASLVKDAARSIALYLDLGGSLEDPLIRPFFDALEIPAPARIGSRLSALGTAKDVGRHARIVFDAADAGSQLADEVIRQGGHGLADLVRRLKVQGSPATSVVAGGSVIVSQPRLWAAFRQGVADAVGPGMSLFLNDAAPVEGAVVLADQLAARRAAISPRPTLERVQK